ncbi:DNA mismatch repair protein MutS [Salinibacter ruber]|uniref:DNA mismatch repair protein MutS n=2 Tax=Salinibacter ruber TaxID=146919 RepID=MUTS_SALRD|nr:DNA mismatch repair protein MutS [Salinibacter ruber]Q2S254.1 RecName: Full=DNA mismatch repair protein MutS [Salinibacter ruber DSM 13855]ABC45289.1 DNA mismatch repair protein MutS [Salinibacter ruber DSM 13855]MBB4060400.1 DNA mismatch repair protein MutS [Salinibacter ruber]MBB4068057.1 DNA mismatch repair protein MutS [Salinibacter ruber]MCS3683137.1 DNA mismatch repair protein MutS [Salinibacter ruber]MCS3855071.1 DNA mismatch repair protein MutS [Salinibacter ruber]
MAQSSTQQRGRTPLMRQYYKIKERHPKAILLFRMGDFYESFDDDAKTVSRLLGITLTERNNGDADDVPMAGFPHHALDSHLPKLIRSGLRVAICEQVEDADDSSGKVVDRDVVEVVTPGVSFHDQLLNPKQSNFLAALHFGTGRDKDRIGFSFIDATTGEFSVTEAGLDQLQDLIQTVAPSEVIVDKRKTERLQQHLREVPFTVTEQEDWVFKYDFAYQTLLEHFETHSLKGFGVDDMDLGVVASGAALHYLGETQKGALPHVRKIKRYSKDEHIALDPETKRNLELVQSIQDDGHEGTLVSILDETETPMGGRRLRAWLVRPLRDVGRIRHRLDAVEACVDDRTLRDDLREELNQMGDLERLAGKVATGRAAPGDLIAIKHTLRRLPNVLGLLTDADSDALGAIEDDLRSCPEMVDRIQSALVDDPPAKISEGGLIRDGYSEELDELRTIAQEGKDWVANLETEESERTDIPSLKVGFNKVFGYYIEVTNTHADKVPEDYIRKQTLVDSERYVTPELKEMEEKILTAEEKIETLEQELFNELRSQIAQQTGILQENAELLAHLDCFAGLAEVAEQHDYTRPSVDDGLTIDIEEGRHPVVEQTLPPGDPFIPNDMALDPDDEQVLIITGPNMAGKSVALRQVGLIVLLAQVGSFVPAEAAQIGVVDRIFTRVGASDNLAAGESTFLVEMNEAANILNNATARSLILFDEVGRGTSTFDGLSIAWAIVEYLHERPEVAARTLFATHYHELNAMADRLERVHNYRIQVSEHEGEIVFLRKLIPGGADHSYGIEVAKMAGLPDAVIARAREVLQNLESQHLEVGADEADGAPSEDPPSEDPPSGDGVRAKKGEADAVPDLEDSQANQMHLFGQPDPAAEEIKEMLGEIDPNRITPVEALMKLAEMKETLAD